MQILRLYWIMKLKAAIIVILYPVFNKSKYLLLTRPHCASDVFTEALS